MRQFQHSTSPSQQATDRRSSTRRLLARALNGVASRLMSAARPAAPVPQHGAFEPLERRQLLTTLFGGETFQFASFNFGTIGDDGQLDTFPVIVQVQGSADTQVRLLGIGSGINGFGLSDMSGVITESPIEGRVGPVRGGFGGEFGSMLLTDEEFTFLNEIGAISKFNTTDYVGAPIPGSIGGVLLGTQDLIQFSHMAANDAGEVYGLQLVDIPIPGGPTIRQVQIAQFNKDRTDLDPLGANDMRTPGGGSLGDQTNVGDALFVGDIIEQMLDAVRGEEGGFPPEDPDDPLADRDFVVSLFGADFAPGDNDTLYVGANITVERATTFGNPNPTEVDLPYIFAVDLNTLSVTAVASDFWGDVQSRDAETVAQNVTAFAMQDADTIALFGSFTERFNEATQQQNTVTNTGVLVVDLNTAFIPQFIDIDDVIPVTVGDEALEGLASLEYRPRTATFNPPDELGRLYGLTLADDGGDAGPQVIRFGQGQFGTFTVIGGIAEITGTAAGANATALTWDPTLENPFTENVGGFVTFDQTTDQFLMIDQRPRAVASSSLALYNIQVINGDENTRITMYALDPQSGEPITLEGNAGPVANYFNEDEGELVPVESPDGTGALYLGLKWSNDDDIVVTIPEVNPNNMTEGSLPFSGKTFGGMVRPGLYTQNSSLGAFHYAGIVTGAVRIEGALGEFIAGAILTGDAGLNGISEPDNFAVYGDVGVIASATSIGSEKVTGNAAGVDDEGTELVYNPGTDFAIGGRVSSIRAAGAIAASFDIRGDNPPAGADLSNTFYKRLNGTSVREIEAQGVDDEIDQLFIGGTPRIAGLNNDDFDSYEPVGTFANGSVQVSGRIAGDAGNAAADDSVDYLGLPLMAGQEVTIQLTSPSGGPTTALRMGLFDPEGRLIATDHEDNAVSTGAVNSMPIRFRATSAGVYRIAVATVPDADFNEAGGEFSDQLYTEENYTVRIEDAGNVTVGGIKAQGLIYANASTVNGSDFINVWQGDLGVVESQTGTIFSPFAPAMVRNQTGNIRQVSGSSVGYHVDGTNTIGWVNVRAPKASIGAIRGTGIGGGDYAGDVFFNWTGVFDADNLPLVAQAIGDDIQIVRAARDVMGNFIVGRGIGSIVAGRDFATPVPGLMEGGPSFGTGAIFTNVDDIGNDGFVDMLSVGGNVGVSSSSGRIGGGPAIDVGTGGNFRYFDFPAGATMVRDPLFGSQPEDPFQNIPAGQSFTFTDDSGTSATVRPISGDEERGGVDEPVPAALSVLTYPVRSGGSILVTVNSTSGVEVTTNNRGSGATVEVGNIRTSGEGRPVLRALDPNSIGGEPELVLANSFFDPNDPLGENDPFFDLVIRLEGANVDVFSIDATNTGGEGGKFTEISNNSGGEILDITAASIATLRADRLGISKTRGDAELQAVQSRSSFYPYLNQPYLIGVDGTIITIEGEEMGNIFVGIGQGFDLAGPDEDGGGGGGGGGPTGITGPGGGNGGGDVGGGTGGGGSLPPVFPIIGDRGDSIGGLGAGGTGGVGGIGVDVLGELPGIIGEVRPNRDGVDDPTRHEGINGPIVAATPGTDEVQGEIYFVDIGEGILSSGSGNMALSGIYAEAFIVEVRGTDADIRGDIWAQEINFINLNGGSIIHADIGSVPLRGDVPAGNANFATTREFEFLNPTVPFLVEGGGEDADTVFYEIDEILVTGGGGIIGSTISAADILSVRVSDGFGFLNGTITTLTEGHVELVEADGFGIRNAIIGQGRDVGTVRAIGDADLLNVNDFSGSVDFSGEGMEFDPYTGQFLTPINDLRRALGLPADINPIRKRVTNSGLLENVRVSGSRDVNRVEGVVIRSNLDALNPAGNFEQSNTFGQGNSASPDFGTSVDFGRTINNIVARSTFGLRVEGGDMNNMALDKDMFNTQVRISGRIDNVTMGEDMWRDSSVRADGPDGFLENLEAENIYGFISGDQGIGTVFARNDLFAPTDDPAVPTVTASTLRSLGRIDTVRVGRHMQSGAHVRAAQSIGLLDVGGDIKEGAVVHTTSIDDLQVDGNIFGEIVLTA